MGAGPDGGGAGRRHGVVVSGEDIDPDLHAVEAVRADAADEPPPAGAVERDLVPAGGHHLGGLRRAARREVGATDLHHGVAGFVVLEHCNYARAKATNSIRSSVSLVSRIAVSENEFFLAQEA